MQPTFVMVMVLFVLPSLCAVTSTWIKVRNLEDLFVGSAATTSPPAPKNEDFKTKWTKFEEGGSREGTRGIRSRGKAFRAFAFSYNGSPGTATFFCSCGCLSWERKIWGEACKGQGGLALHRGLSQGCQICYKRYKNIFNRVSASVWCANQEKPKVFRIYDGKHYKANEGTVKCMKLGARWTKMGRLRKGQKWPKHNKFLEKIAQCPPYYTLLDHGARC